jgi:ribosomal-protein-alanine N-acetyltransferase
MPETFRTERLQFLPLSHEDDHFILELLNTDGWIRFIGDRNVHTLEEAGDYITKILGSTNVKYWVVRRHDDPRQLGVVTRIQRDFLPGPDIGFAFLDGHRGAGYAFEGASALLNHYAGTFYAILNPENDRSINLLRKLGFTYLEERKKEDGLSHIYIRQQ